MKYAMLFFLLAALPSAAHAQHPTVDDDGEQVFRESKSPVEWADPGGYGYKVAMDKVAPILRGEKYDDGNDIVSSSFEESWSNILLVADWTGSMYDYAPQALRWHLDNRSRVPIRHLVLFNDGDGKSTSQKEIGKTGGVYFVNNPSDENQVLQAIAEVVDNGSGGDSPENDLEAILSAIQKYDLAEPGSSSPIGFSEVVLIADGDADVRDMELLPRIPYPVHVVACRGLSGMEDYLKIACETEGSVAYGSERVDFSKEKPLAVAFGRYTWKRQEDGDWKRQAGQ